MRRTGAVRGLDTLRGSGELASRRRYLRSVVALGSASLAGCLDAGIGSVGNGDGGNDGQSQFQQAENPPDAVYVPGHREGVELLGTTTDGPYRFRAMVSYAHPFWIVTGSTIEAVEVTGAVDVHLMIAVEDAESGTTLPVDSGLTTTVRDADGRLVDTRSPWRMLSQTMGVHFGDNVPLDGDGTYEVSVAVPPMDTLTTGTFDGRFDASATTSFSITYDQALRDRLIERIQYVDDDQRVGAEDGVTGAAVAATVTIDIREDAPAANATILIADPAAHLNGSDFPMRTFGDEATIVVSEGGAERRPAYEPGTVSSDGSVAVTTANDSNRTVEAGSDGGSSETNDPTPGFGIGIAVVAVLVASVLALRR